MEYQKLSKKAMGVIVVTAVLQAIIFAALITFAAFMIKEFLYFDLPFAAIGLTSAIIGLLYCLILPPFRHRRYRYLIGADRIEIIEGVIFIRRTIVTIDRIYQIEISRGPIDNIFGVAKVVITTAGSTAVFRFLELSKAEALAEQLHLYVKEKIQGSGGGQNV